MDQLWLKTSIFVLVLINLRSQMGRVIVKTMVEAEAMYLVS